MEETDSGMCLPIYVGAAGPRSTTIETFTGRCFDFSIEWMGFSEDSSTFDWRVTASNKQSFACTDTLWFANTEMDRVELFVMPGVHDFTFDVTSEEM